MALPDFQALHRLVKRNDLQFFRSAITNKLLSDWLVSSQSKCGESLLHIACRYDKNDILECLVIDHHADFEASNHEGKKPLHEAAQFGSHACLNFLLKSRVHVDSLKRADWTPLMLACTKDNLDVVQLLLNFGADPCLKNKDDWNSFHIACREGHVEILKVLVKISPMVYDTKSTVWRTPLHTAALHGKLEAVLWLLESCVFDVNAVDSCGNTPFMDALRSGHVDIAARLADQYQADAFIEDKVGRQALHHAAQAGQRTALEFLLTKMQVPVNIASKSTQETALHTASKEGQTAMVELLISHGADVNLTDSKGRTALHIASGAQSAECVHSLLKHNSILVSDHNGKLPSDLAIKQSVIDVFHSLKNCNKEKG